MQTKVIREKFLNFFKNNGHTVVESSSLIPINDPTLLFTNAGMVQFKDTFLGKEKRSYNTATSAQKCVRAGGKHNDLDNVGYTARHHTFFEMLGNFSFGAYFKEQAIKYAWKFTTEELKLPKDKLYVSIYEDDDEAFDIWNKTIGLDSKRIFRFGKKDNFWSMGDTGPCGPCSELFIDRGEKYGCGKPDCNVGCDCDRYMEFWNLVFMQYNRDSKGNMTPLPRPSVDTGAGLERLASILQNVDSNYDIDIFKSILEKTAALVGKKYGADHNDDIALRVISDHARSSTFLIADGVLPSNEGRGYVLRRIIRRAVRYGKNLGFTSPFLYKVSRFVVDEMNDQYPYLEKQFSLVQSYIKKEEQQFFKTLQNGLDLLEVEIKNLQASGSSTLSGDVVFKLYDTYGFPLDLTMLICKEKSISVDESDFDKRMEEQKSRSKKSWKGALSSSVLDSFVTGLNFQQQSSCYTLLESSSECMGVVIESDPATLYAVFKSTPFYPEGGGQICDIGTVSSSDFSGSVIDVQKKAGFIIHTIKVSQGSLKVGDKVNLKVDVKRRNLLATNHSSVHLLHWALRTLLGDHVKQAGSYVSDTMFRLDFTHFEQISRVKLKEIERLVNEKIWEASPIVTEVLSKEEALNKGALAFFNEKYSDTVRMVTMGPSKELCGGTHAKNTSDLHMVRLLSEESIASGVRRIIGVSGWSAYEYTNTQDDIINELSSSLKISQNALSERISKMVQDEKDLKLELESYKQKDMARIVDSFIKNQTKDLSGIKVVTGTVDIDKSRFRSFCEQLRSKNPDGICVIGQSSTPGSVTLIVTVGDGMVTRYSSNTLLQKLAPCINGKGGGKAGIAQAGGTKPEGLSEVFSKLEDVIKSLS